MLFANGAVFFKLQTIGIVALIFKAVVIAVMALRAFEGDFHSRRFGSHVKTPYKKITPPLWVLKRV